MINKRSRRLVVLAYHDVSDPGSFKRHVEYLSTAMSPISGEELLAAQRGDHELPDGAVLVTFDDGDRTVYEAGLPILRERAVPAVLFPISGLIDSDRAPWFREVRDHLRQGARSDRLAVRAPDEAVRLLKRLPDAVRREIIDELRACAPRPACRPQLRPHELRDLQAAGVEIGNHTHTHPCLDRCSSGEIVEELQRAHDSLSSWLGKPPRLFAYPNGNSDVRAERILASLGYEAAFLFDHRIGRFPVRDRMRISRVRVNSTARFARFRAIVSGLHPMVHHLRGRN